MDEFAAALGDDRLWFWDESHWPHPVTPLTATVELPAMAAGFSRACRELRRAVSDYAIRAVHGFVYMGVTLEPDAGRRATARAVADAALTPWIGGALRFWSERVLPEVSADIDRLRRTDWQHLSDAALAEAIAALPRLRTRHWQLHDLVIVPAMAAQERFTALYQQCFPDDRPGAAALLLRGWPTSSTAAATALWRLSQQPEVTAWLTEGGKPPASWRAYLEEWGWRSEGLELADPAFHERPAPLIARLERYARGRHPDPEAALARAAAERERGIAGALARLAGGAERQTFMDALTAARAYPVLSEDHNHVIDQMGLTLLRLPLLAAGHRLAARGILATAADVFYLQLDELTSALAATALPPAAAVATRQAERRRWWGERPPAVLGMPLPPELADDPVYAGFFGLAHEPDAPGNVLHGTPAAPGVVAGPARVAHTLADADLLQPGEILVAATTTPAWTPLFATAAAVVTGSGGTLSHTAIVAREYGIPCVTGVRSAPLRIITGRWITVDGSAGMVTLD